MGLVSSYLYRTDNYLVLCSNEEYVRITFPSLLINVEVDRMEKIITIREEDYNLFIVHLNRDFPSMPVTELTKKQSKKLRIVLATLACMDANEE